MDKPKFFDLVEGYARFQPIGQATLPEAVAMVGEAIAYCYQERISHLLVDLRQQTGHAPPTIVDRYWIAQDWAQKAKGKVIVSMVVPPEVPDPDHFEEIAAANVGQRAGVFASEAEAVEWLLNQP